MVRGGRGSTEPIVLCMPMYMTINYDDDDVDDGHCKEVWTKTTEGREREESTEQGANGMALVVCFSSITRPTITIHPSIMMHTPFLSETKSLVDAPRRPFPLLRTDDSLRYAKRIQHNHIFDLVLALG
jgi:hypothetical protein